MNERKTAQALLIIDMQNDFVHPGTPVHVAGAEATVPVIRKLRESCRKHEIPVFHVIRSYSADGLTVERARLADFRRTPFVVPGTLGAEIIKELTPEAGEKTVIKPRYSAFFQTSLDLMLKRLGVERVLVSGTQYPNCIRATVNDALSLDYAVSVITDACSAKTEAVAAANILDMRNLGAECITFTEWESRQR